MSGLSIIIVACIVDYFLGYRRGKIVGRNEVWAIVEREAFKINRKEAENNYGKV